MYRVKDIYGEKYLWLTDLIYGNNVLKAHRVPITIEGLKLEIHITKDIIMRIKHGKWD